MSLKSDHRLGADEQPDTQTGAPTQLECAVQSELSVQDKGDN